jgi:membrane-bound ClpP family serine protease
MIHFFVKKVNIKLIKRTVADWLKIIIFLLDDAVALFLIILLLRFMRIQIPLPIVILLAILVGAFVFIVHKAIIPDFRRKPVTGQEGMIGLEGRVIKTLTPVGTVIVGGEYWWAKSVNGNIGIGESIEIVGVDRLTLKVKRKDQ